MHLLSRESDMVACHLFARQAVSLLSLLTTLIGAEAAGAEPGVPAMSTRRTDVRPFEYVDVGNRIPNYLAGQEWGTQGEAFSKMQLPLEPAESLKHLVTPVDFEARLFAAEPHIRRPICMNWDERGRLWVAESVDYPNSRQGPGQGHDRIVICEDTDGDGVADKFTVFADKLSIPTGFTFYKGGVLVVQAPDTLYLKDTDGDGIADERRVLFSGWGTRDSHAGPSNLRWGFDNWVYGICGYAGFNGEVGGERHKFSQGFFRFRPDGSKLEFLRSTDNNSWGLGISEDGLVFGSTANGNPSVYLPIPNRYYEGVRGWSAGTAPGIAGNAPIYPITDKVRQVDWHGHFTAAAGHALYTARSYPRDYWNRAAFVCEPTGHLTATFLLERRGSDFVSHNAWNLLASDDEWCAPIQAEVGPDGNVWVIDWYNYIVQHNPTPRGFKTGRGNAYDTDLRDKTHGRIYRLLAKNARTARPVNLAATTPPQLVAALRSDNLLWRMHAQRLLVERGRLDVVPDLAKLAGDVSVDEIGLNPGAIHALWTLQGLGMIGGADDSAARSAATRAALQALKHPSAAVRRSAVLVLPRDSRATELLIARGLLNDPDAQVRLAAALALAEMPSSALVGERLVEMLERPENAGDRWIPDAATAAAARHALSFLRAVAARKSPGAGRVREIVQAVAEHLARGADVAALGPVLTALAEAKDPAVAELVLAGLSRGWPRGRAANLPAATEAALESRLGSLNSAGKVSLLRLADSWGCERLNRHFGEVAKALLAVASDDKHDEPVRIAAARDYVSLRPGELRAAEQVLELVTPRSSPTLAVGLIDALGASTTRETSLALIARLSGLPPGARSAAVRWLLSRVDGTRALLDAMDDGRLQGGELTLDQKEALVAHPNKGIASRARTLLARGGALPNSDRQRVIDELTPLTERTGDAVRGLRVFEKSCASCHMHSGKGATIAPDLTGMSTHPKSELLVHIMDPSRSVEANYRVYMVTLQNGRFLTGLLASETKTSIEVVDSQANRHRIPRDTIEELLATDKSLMPDGFEKQLSRDELVDLLEFLTQRVRYVPLSIEKVATAVSTLGLFSDKDAISERLVFADWSPKTFHGVPFKLVDPKGTEVANVILLHGTNGSLAPTPKSVKLPFSGSVKVIHLLSGISARGYPGGNKGSVSLIVRVHYADGTSEDQPLKNGEHFADYARRVDVPGSEFAFDLQGHQVRYLAVHPERAKPLRAIELVKGEDATAPIVVAITVETAP
jgi:putative membrane-bound dehydrogenase-like protein